MTLPRDLGDGLRLRRAETPKDIERIIELDNAVVQEEEPDEDLSGWIRALTDGTHPTTTLQDFYLVEDTEKDLFVSSMCLIPQTWAYDGIRFGVGRPEIVMTRADYRRRGLVRAQFQTLHEDCAARDLVVQAITGIPYFYRQFDYEYALTLSAGCDLFFDAVPALAEDGKEPYSLRPLKENDLPTAMALDEALERPQLVTSVCDEAMWRYRVFKEEEHVATRSYYALVERESGHMVGDVAVGDVLWFGAPIVQEMALSEGVPYSAVMPSLLRALVAWSQKKWPDKRRLQFELGDAHPAYPALKAYGAKQRALPYAWYIRVPDVPGFLRRIAPALERRLAESGQAGYSGEIKIGFYARPGVSLTFEEGKIARTAALDAKESDVHAGFPPLVFLKLLFGCRTYEELRYIYPDVWATRQTKLVLGALFPQQPSWVRLID